MESRELRRVDAGPAPSEAADGFLVQVAVHARDPLGTLSRVREVLHVILANRDASSVDDWNALMPAWFLTASAPELTQEEADAALTRWRANPAAHQDEPWSLMNWVYWFEPEMRSWWWWDGRVQGPDRLAITIVVEGHPFADGALRWLLQSAGAEAVVIDGD